MKSYNVEDVNQWKDSPEFEGNTVVKESLLKAALTLAVAFVPVVVLTMMPDPFYKGEHSEQEQETSLSQSARNLDL